MTPRRALLALFLFVAVVYGATMCRTIGPGDSGELVTVMSTWGVAHAPGYPLLSLVGNLWRLLPIGSESALRLTILNVLFAVAAVVFVAATVMRMTDGKILPAIAAALALAFSRAYWEYAVVTEVFALNSLAGAILLWTIAEAAAMAKSSAQSPTRVFVVAAIAMSAAVTHHQTLVLLAIPVLVGFCALIPQYRAAKTALLRPITTAFAAGCAALLPLIYLPFAARRSPDLNWDDPRDLDGFLHILLRKDFGTGDLMTSELVAMKVLDHGPDVGPGPWTHLYLFAHDLAHHFSLVFPLCFLIGIVVACRRHVWARFFVPVFFLGLTLFFRRVNAPLLPLFDGVVERFHILPHVGLAVFAGVGISAIVDFLVAKTKKSWVGAAALFLIFALGPATELLHHYRDVDQSKNTFTRDLGIDFLESLPERALVFGQGDMLHNGTFYAQLCLGKRKDVLYIDLQKLSYPWYVEELKRRDDLSIPPRFNAYDPSIGRVTSLGALLDANFGTRPIVALRIQDETWRSQYVLRPFGPWSLFDKKGSAPDLENRARSARELAGKLHLESAQRRHGPREWEKDESAYYGDILSHIGAIIELTTDFADGRFDDTPRPEIAEIYRRAEKVDGLDERAILARRATNYWNLLLEKSGHREPVGGDAAALEKARRLFEKSAEHGKVGVDASVALLTIMKLPSQKALADIEYELGHYRRILDSRPSDIQRLNEYLALVSQVVTDAKVSHVDHFRDAVHRLGRAHGLFEAAARHTKNPYFSSTRDALKKNLDRTTESFETYRKRFP